MGLTFDESNRIWQYSWQELNLTSEFTLSILPCYDGNVSTPAIKTLPQGLITSVKYNYEYDKLPVGTAKSPELEITFNLDILYEDDANSDNLIFAKALVNFAETEITGVFPNPADNFKIRLGNIYHLYYGSQLIFCGLQVEETAENNKFTIKARELGVAILQSITKEQLQKTFEYLESKRQTIVGKNTTIDWFNSNLGLANIQHEEVRLWFTKLKNLDEYFKTLGNEIFEKLTRGVGSGFDVDYTNIPVKFYKPDINNSGLDGGNLNYSELYIKCNIEQDEEIEGIGNWLADSYESAWDYYFDVTRNLFVRGWFSYTYNISYKVVSSCKFEYKRILPNNYITLEADKVLSTKYEYYLNKGLVVSADIKDDTGIDEVRIKNVLTYMRRARNIDNYVIPIFWHNIPKIESEDNFKNKQTQNIATFNKQSLLHFNGVDFILIFPEVNFEITATKGSENVIYYGGFTNSKNRAFKFSELKNLYENKLGFALINTLVMTYLFNGNGVNEIEVETLLDSATILLCNPIDYGFSCQGETKQPYATIHNNLLTNYGIVKFEAELLSTENKYCKVKINGFSVEI